MRGKTIDPVELMNIHVLIGDYCNSLSKSPITPNKVTAREAICHITVTPYLTFLILKIT